MRTLQLSILVLLLIGVSGCGKSGGGDAEFVRIADNYIEEMLRLNPESATWMGDHRFDHMMNDYTLDGYGRQLQFYQRYMDSLATIDTSRLNTTNRIDYELMMHGIKYRIFRLDTLRSYEWNPRNYNPGGAIYSLLARDFAPLEERLRSVKGRLEAIPDVLGNARINLKNPPKIHTETAILQNKGTINLINIELNEYLNEAPEMVEEIKPAQEEAVAALEDYGRWLEEELLPASNGDFRLGDELYRKKLSYAIYSNMPREGILSRAEADLVAAQEELYQTALPLFMEYFPDESGEDVLNDKKAVIKRVLDHLAEDRPTAEDIVDKAKACLDECVNFVREHDIVTLPDKPIDIIVMPEFQRGVAVAYCSSPGPLEKEGETFYAISPPPADWDEEQVESYFREYNDHLLYNLTIHEAMPGHYLQAAHANQFEAPTLTRRVFGSGTFSEGWATYCEEMMIEEGFGGPELKMQMLKMDIRAIINAIIDQKIHTGGMTEEEAMDMMLNEGFQEQGEAAGKWRRACLSSVQLSTYYVGNFEVKDIRKDYEEKMGDDFNLMEFNDKLLSFGTPPPKYVRILMAL